jgi:hypothetical protein
MMRYVEFWTCASRAPPWALTMDSMPACEQTTTNTILSLDKQGRESQYAGLIMIAYMLSSGRGDFAGYCG